MKKCNYFKLETFKIFVVIEIKTFLLCNFVLFGIYTKLNSSKFKKKKLLVSVHYKKKIMDRKANQSS